MSKTRFDILASAAQTATGQGGAISVSGIKNLALAVDITCQTGTLTGVYLQGSSDGGTTWFDLLATTSCWLTSGAGVGTTGGPTKVLAGNLLTGNVAKVWANYQIIGDYVRAAWGISGAAPWVTIGVKGIGEN
jgi:hypothetical protein